MTFRKILIALSDGPIAAHAVDVGVELARALKADIALIHVMEPVSYGADIGVPPVELETLAKQEGHRLLDGVRQRLSLEPSALEFLEAGNSYSEIIKAAKVWPADLIVIGSHGRGGLERVLLGSVAECYVRHVVLCLSSGPTSDSRHSANPSTLSIEFRETRERDTRCACFQ